MNRIASQMAKENSVELKRITQDRINRDKQKPPFVRSLERMVAAKFDHEWSPGANYFKTQKDSSKGEVTVLVTATQPMMDTPRQATYLLEEKLCIKLPSVQEPIANGRMKTRTMIRALQMQRISMCLKRKRESPNTCSKFTNSANGPHIISVFPKKCISAPTYSQVECFHCKGSLSSGQVVSCSSEDCWRVYHLSCTQSVEGFSWRRHEKLICPHHVCTGCRKVRSSRLFRCERCPIAFHQCCCPSPQDTKFYSSRLGWAICWRHSTRWMLQNMHKQPTSDIKEVFCRLPLPDRVKDFQITSSFWKGVMESDKEPPPYTHIRRNVFLIKKKRDDFDDGASCSCHPHESQVCGEDCECRVQSMSCSKACNCNDQCTNKPFRKERRVKVVNTEHCGWGAEASEAIEKGEFIIEYTGEVIDDAICEMRLWAMKGRSVHNFYMCEIAKDFIIDATFKGNASRYLNHSCEPNCKLEKWRVDGETRVGVFALANIHAGEPLTYNYKFIDYGMKAVCRCGAPSCRGAIGEKFGSSAAKSNGVMDQLAAWGGKKKRSDMEKRHHIRYVVRSQDCRLPARGS